MSFPARTPLKRARPTRAFVAFDVDVDWDRSAGVREQRQRLATELDELRKRVYERRISYKEQLRMDSGVNATTCCERGTRRTTLRPQR